MTSGMETEWTYSAQKPVRVHTITTAAVAAAATAAAKTTTTTTTTATTTTTRNLRSESTNLRRSGGSGFRTLDSRIRSVIQIATKIVSLGP